MLAGWRRTHSPPALDENALPSWLDERGEERTVPSPQWCAYVPFTIEQDEYLALGPWGALSKLPEALDKVSGSPERWPGLVDREPERSTSRTTSAAHPWAAASTSPPCSAHHPDR